MLYILFRICCTLKMYHCSPECRTSRLYGSTVNEREVESCLPGMLLDLCYVLTVYGQRRWGIDMNRLPCWGLSSHPKVLGYLESDGGYSACSVTSYQMNLRGCKAINLLNDPWVTDLSLSWWSTFIVVDIIDSLSRSPTYSLWMDHSGIRCGHLGFWPHYGGPSLIYPFACSCPYRH